MTDLSVMPPTEASAAPTSLGTTSRNPATLALLPGAPAAANAMYNLIVGSWASQIVGTMARLRIPDQLAGMPQTAEQLAAAGAGHPDGLFRLLRAASVFGVVSMSADRTFSLTPLGSTLESTAPGSLRGLASTLTAPCHWVPWGHLDEAITTGQCPAPDALGRTFYDYLQEQPDQLSEFAAAMQGLSELIEAEVVAHLDLSAVTDFVDIAGGSGSLSAALLDAHPHLRATILELPSVAPAARALIETRGFADRCSIVEGDFFRAVPEADVHIMKLIIHDWDDERASTILQNCARSLRPGGKVYIVDAIVPEDSSHPLPALLDLHMQVVLGGRERTVPELVKLLASAGLQFERVIPTSSHGQIVQATHV